jgi:hypothetical protein
MNPKSGRIGRISWWAHVEDNCIHASWPAKLAVFRGTKPRPQPFPIRTEPAGEVIAIPPALAARELAQYPMSARLRSALNYNNYWLLGDLDGVAYADLRQLRNCGKVSVAELKRFINGLQSAAGERL